MRRVIVPPSRSATARGLRSFLEEPDRGDAGDPVAIRLERIEVLLGDPADDEHLGRVRIPAGQVPERLRSERRSAGALGRSVEDRADDDHVRLRVDRRPPPRKPNASRRRSKTRGAWPRGPAEAAARRPGDGPRRRRRRERGRNGG